jgi:hypothetical protein
VRAGQENRPGGAAALAEAVSDGPAHDGLLEERVDVAEEIERWLDPTSRMPQGGGEVRVPYSLHRTAIEREPLRDAPEVAGYRVPERRLGQRLRQPTGP